MCATAYSLAMIDEFLQGLKDKKQRFCVIDLTKADNINLAVFNEQKCEHLRKIPCDDIGEVKKEIVQSLRSVCANSQNKKYDKFYILGEIKEQEELIKQLKNSYDVAIDVVTDIRLPKEILPSRYLFKMNMVKNYSLNFNQRSNIVKATNAVLALSVVLFMFFTAKIVQSEISIKHIKKSFSESQYQHALDLQKQVKELRDVRK